MCIHVHVGGGDSNALVTANIHHTRRRYRPVDSIVEHHSKLQGMLSIYGGVSFMRLIELALCTPPKRHKVT